MRLDPGAGEASDNCMDTAKVDTGDDVLKCPRCGSKEMVIYIEDNGVQREKCAHCNNLVAFTSELIRILEKQ
jgi:hypothetical protein